MWSFIQSYTSHNTLSTESCLQLIILSLYYLLIFNSGTCFKRNRSASH